jgi:hypothetical protein
MFNKLFAKTLIVTVLALGLTFSAFANVAAAQSGRFYFTVPPGSRAVISVTGDALWEQAVVVSTNRNARVAELGNYQRARVWDSGENTTGRSITYTLAGFHKESPPDGGMPWFSSLGLITRRSARVMSIGFEDSTDDDYNDLIVNVSISN